MSQANVELVRQVFEAWNQHDSDLLLSHLDPEGEADWSESQAPYRGIYRGHAEVKAFFEALLEAWDAVRWEPLEVRDLGYGRVLSVNRLTGRGRDSGVEVTASGAVVWTVRDDKVFHAKLFQSEQEALEAVGLSE